MPSHSCVRFSRRRAFSISNRNFPTVLAVFDVQNVKIVQILGNVVLRIVGFVGEAREQKNLVAD